MSSRLFVIGLVTIWAALMLVSFFAVQAVEGPQNMDTGFRRLDVLLTWQLIAAVVAVASAIAAFAQKDLTRGLRALGYMPLVLTAAALVLVIAAA
jgi:FtsH-binding integral membrane protein